MQRLNFHSVCYIFATKSAWERGRVRLHSQPGSYYLISSLRDVHHPIWRANFFSRLERTHTPGRESSKPQGVAMPSDSRRGSFGFRRRDRDARSARGYTCMLSQKPRPAQRGRNCKKSLTETAAVVTHCVFLLPPVGSSRRHKEQESIGQLSVYI